MKQYKIDSSNIPQDSNDDCYLAPDDPVHELKIAASLGGLGAAERLANYRAQQATLVVGSNKGQTQREQSIKPGTKEWFQLWFGQ